MRKYLFIAFCFLLILTKSNAESEPKKWFIEPNMGLSAIIGNPIIAADPSNKGLGFRNGIEGGLAILYNLSSDNLVQRQRETIGISFSYSYSSVTTSYKNIQQHVRENYSEKIVFMGINNNYQIDNLFLNTSISVGLSSMINSPRIRFEVNPGFHLFQSLRLNIGLSYVYIKSEQEILTDGYRTYNFSPYFQTKFSISYLIGAL